VTGTPPAPCRVSRIRRAGSDRARRAMSREQLRQFAFIDLYIHPLYVLVNKILSFILNSTISIHSLYHPLSTLSIVGSICHFI
jgi:hypothetical protein